MIEKSNHKLIDGKFSANEAGKILFTLINSKINYHNLDAFISQEREGKISTKQNKRIKELTEVNTAIKKIIDYANKQKLQLQINSNIEITLIK